MSYLKQFYNVINNAILGMSSRWHGLMLVVTLLAGPVFVSICGVIFALIGWLNRKPLILKLALLVCVTYLLVTILKHLFRRPRPDTEYARNIKFSKYSFPSGHAAVGSVLWYGILLALSNLGLSIGIFMVMTFLTPILVVLIGVSRVYLGAHYLSDVLVGWLIGLLMIIGFYVLV